MFENLKKIVEYIQGDSKESLQTGVSDWEKTFIFSKLITFYKLPILFYILMGIAFAAQNNQYVNIFIGLFIIFLPLPLIITSPFLIFFNLSALITILFPSFNKKNRWRLIVLTFLAISFFLPLALNISLVTKYKKLEQGDISNKLDFKNADVAIVMGDKYKLSQDNKMICDLLCEALLKGANANSVKLVEGSESNMKWTNAKFEIFYNESSGSKLDINDDISASSYLLIESDLSPNSNSKSITKRYEVFKISGQNSQKIYQNTYMIYDTYFPFLLLNYIPETIENNKSNFFPHPMSIGIGYNAENKIRKSAEIDILRALNVP